MSQFYKIKFGWFALLMITSSISANPNVSEPTGHTSIEKLTDLISKNVSYTLHRRPRVPSNSCNIDVTNTESGVQCPHELTLSVRSIAVVPDFMKAWSIADGKVRTQAVKRSLEQKRNNLNFEGSPLINDLLDRINLSIRRAQ